MRIVKLKGLIAAAFTPFDENGEINLSVIPDMADSLTSDGVSGVYVCGSTGEGISCSVEERIRIMKAWSRASGGRLKLIAHTGALSLKDVAVLNREAVSCGYDAFSVIPPSFFKPGDARELVDYCRAAAESAPELPFYYYHTMKSGLEISMRDFLKYADGKIPNLAGVKFNHYNLYDFQNALHACGGKYDIVFGVDECFAGALALGAKAFIGSTYNYSASLYHIVWKAFEAGDWNTVADTMHRICLGVDLLVQYGGIPAGKAMMLIKGIDCGKARLPLKQLSPEERQTVAGAMKKLLSSEKGGGNV